LIHPDNRISVRKNRHQLEKKEKAYCRLFSVEVIKLSMSRIKVKKNFYFYGINLKSVYTSPAP